MLVVLEGSVGHAVLNDTSVVKKTVKEERAFENMDKE